MVIPSVSYTRTIGYFSPKLCVNVHVLAGVGCVYFFEFPPLTILTLPDIGTGNCTPNTSSLTGHTLLGIIT